MKIIVPMAGRGSRLRPHTLTVPKPLIPIAGKPIVQRLVEDIAKVAGENIDEIAFIIGDFGPEVEQSLIEIAEKLGAVVEFTDIAGLVKGASRVIVTGKQIGRAHV